MARAARRWRGTRPGAGASPATRRLASAGGGGARSPNPPALPPALPPGKRERRSAAGKGEPLLPPPPFASRRRAPARNARRPGPALRCRERAGCSAAARSRARKGRGGRPPRPQRPLSVPRSHLPPHRRRSPRPSRLSPPPGPNGRPQAGGARHAPHRQRPPAACTRCHRRPPNRGRPSFALPAPGRPARHRPCPPPFPRAAAAGRRRVRQGGADGARVPGAEGGGRSAEGAPRRREAWRVGHGGGDAAVPDDRATRARAGERDRRRRKRRRRRRDNVGRRA